MKKGLVLVLVAVASVAAWFVFTERQNNVSGDGLRLYGNVDIREVQMGFRVAGRLKEMKLEEGDRVAAGDLLAVLDDRPLREALAVAEAGVSEARANLARARTGSRPQEIQQAEALVAEAQAALANADKRLARQRKLFDDGLNSKGALDDAVATQEQAAARLHASREALALAVEGVRIEDIDAAAAALAAAEARRDQAQTQLEDTRLHAPSDGVIQVRAREPGAMLNAGEPVYTVSLTNSVYVRAYVGEIHLGQVQPGATVTVTADSVTQAYQGRVGFISPRAEFTPKTVETPELRTDLVYRLRIVVEDADAQLRQGMPVTINLGSAGG